MVAIALIASIFHYFLFSFFVRDVLERQSRKRREGHQASESFCSHHDYYSRTRLKGPPKRPRFLVLRLYNNRKHHVSDCNGFFFSLRFIWSWSHLIAAIASSSPQKQQRIVLECFSFGGGTQDVCGKMKSKWKRSEREIGDRRSIIYSLLLLATIRLLAINRQYVLSRNTKIRLTNSSEFV